MKKTSKSIRASKAAQSIRLKKLILAGVAIILTASIPAYISYQLSTNAATRTTVNSVDATTGQVVPGGGKFTLHRRASTTSPWERVGVDVTYTTPAEVRLATSTKRVGAEYQVRFAGSTTDYNFFGWLTPRGTAQNLNDSLPFSAAEMSVPGAQLAMQMTPPGFGDGGSTTQKPILSFKVDGQTPDSTGLYHMKQGSRLLITWTVSGGTAEYCSAGGDWDGFKNVKGGTEDLSNQISANNYDKIFSLNCVNAAGSSLVVVTIEIS